MRFHRDGFTTLECLVALVVFAVGALGTIAATGLAVRLAHEGSQTSRAARLLLDEAARLAADLAGAGGACAAASPANQFGQDGTRLTSVLTPAPGGQELRLSVSYPTARGQYTDSARGFLSCH